MEGNAKRCPNQFGNWDMQHVPSCAAWKLCADTIVQHYTPFLRNTSCGCHFLVTEGKHWAHLTEEHLPDVVISAEDHSTLCITGGANFPKLSLTAGTLKASTVPVAVHGVEQEAVGDLAPTPGAPFPGEGASRHRGRLGTTTWVHHGLRKEQKRGQRTESY